MMPRTEYSFTKEPRGELYRDLIDAGVSFCERCLFVVRQAKTDILADSAEDLIERLKPFLVVEELRSEWPGTKLVESLGLPFGLVLVREYSLTLDSAELLKDATDSLYSWLHPNLPEDLSLLRSDGSPWLTTISHERYSCLSLTEGERTQLEHTFPQLAGLLRKREPCCDASPTAGQSRMAAGRSRIDQGAQPMGSSVKENAAKRFAAKRRLRILAWCVPLVLIASSFGWMHPGEAPSAFEWGSRIVGIVAALLLAPAILVISSGRHVWGQIAAGVFATGVAGFIAFGLTDNTAGIMQTAGVLQCLWAAFVLWRVATDELARFHRQHRQRIRRELADVLGPWNLAFERVLRLLTGVSFLVSASAFGWSLLLVAEPEYEIFWSVCRWAGLVFVFCGGLALSTILTFDEFREQPDRSRIGSSIATTGLLAALALPLLVVLLSRELGIYHGLVLGGWTVVCGLWALGMLRSAKRARHSDHYERIDRIIEKDAKPLAEIWARREGFLHRIHITEDMLCFESYNCEHSYCWGEIQHLFVTSVRSSLFCRSMSFVIIDRSSTVSVEGMPLGRPVIEERDGSRRCVSADRIWEAWLEATADRESMNRFVYPEWARAKDARNAWLTGILCLGLAVFGIVMSVYFWWQSGVAKEYVAVISGIALTLLFGCAGLMLLLKPRLLREVMIHRDGLLVKYHDGVEKKIPKRHVEFRKGKDGVERIFLRRKKMPREFGCLSYFPVLWGKLCEMGKKESDAQGEKSDPEQAAQGS